MKNTSSFSKNEKRSITIGSSHENHKIYQSNYVRTTKYTAITFLPYALFNQFKRYANIYFLISAILQSISAISPLNPLSAIAPLTFVISLSIIREGYEDLKRYKSDIETNSKKTKRYCQSTGDWEVDVLWKDIFVGDIIKVEDEDYFPADLIVLCSSNMDGTCFIMTSSLDGEKNLKSKFAIKDIQNQLMSQEDLKICGVLDYGQPNFDLYSFNGELKLSSIENYNVSAKQLLLRESQLKNTQFIIGIVVYTGKDTKIMQNADEPKFKLSKIELMTNNLILLLIGFQVILCLICMLGSILWNLNSAQKYSYFIAIRYKEIFEGILTFFTIYILLNIMIPISLIISLEMVKFTQSYFIDNDIDMRDSENNFSKTFNSSLNEELGQIEYIFTDKTGTLTCNIMEFVYCIIGEQGFGNPNILEEDKLQISKTLSKKNTHVDLKTGVESSFENPQLRQLLKKQIDGKSENLNFKNKNGKIIYQIKNMQQLSEQFFLMLSLNHDCMYEVTKRDGNEKNYQGPSPDEIALVDTAKRFQYEFLKTTNKGKLININNKNQEIEVLETIDFTSLRKRSSIIIKHDGVIKLFTKGADNIIIQRLNKNIEQPYLNNIDYKLKRFSLKGLRTLCYGMRILSQEEWQNFNNQINGLNGDQEREIKIQQIYDQIENELLLIGCTAVEDKLQDNVPQVIADFLDANIKVWMLTGDKLETAENIGFSCRLIQNDYKKLYLKGENKSSFDEKDLQEKYDELLLSLSKKKKNEKYSLIVEGPIIINLTLYEELAKNFIINIFSKCDSVICCRMSPKQKGEIVRFVKKHQSKITLAIGDGANDVNMIQEAHIGIGLYGKEGLRAVQSSDYALREFKNLWKLLFVHGRWSYIRISEMIVYFYYKNIVIAMPQFLFALQNAWSGQTIFDDFYIIFYNLAFTALPVIIRAILDQDIYYQQYKNSIIKNYDLRKYYHHLYYVGQENLIFEKKIISLWLITGILTSIIIFYLGIYMAESFVINSQAWNIDIWFLSITIYTVIVVVVDIKILFFTRFFTTLSFLSVIIFSIGIFIIYLFVSDMITTFFVFRTTMALISSPIFYLIVLLIGGMGIMFDVLILVMEREIKTPLYLLFKSLVNKTELRNQKNYESIIDNVKGNAKPQKIKAKDLNSTFNSEQQLIFKNQNLQNIFYQIIYSIDLKSVFIQLKNSSQFVTNLL